MIHHRDCIEVMSMMREASVDAIVTDPPYGLEFMGKAWDHGAIGRPFADAMYRVAKPSAYLLAFGGTRTVHRMTCALEDAGWVIRDMLVWGYASGFPKSKASLKPAWEPIVMARKPGPLRMLAIDECRIGYVSDADAANASVSTVRTEQGVNKILGKGLVKAGPVEFDAAATAGRWPANIVLTDPIFDGGIEGVVGGGVASYNPAGVFGQQRGDQPEDTAAPFAVRKDGDGIFGYGDTGTYSRFFLIPKASRSDREPVLDEYAYRLHRERGECDKLGAWESEGRSRSDRTASTSPARATSEATSTADSSSDTSPPGSPSTDQSPMAIRSTTSTATSRTTRSATSSLSIPSLTSGSTPDASSETANGGSPAESADSSSLWEPPTGISVPRAGRSTDDADRATSRSWSSRNVCGRCGKPLPRVGSHPTVKPVDLMRHLVRLVTPQGGVVLDPFLGSGTTAIAAEMEGFEWIGIERESEYVAIAEARLNGTQKGLAL